MKYRVIIDEDDNQKIFRTYAINTNHLNSQVKRLESMGYEIITQRWSKYYHQFIIEYKRTTPSMKLLTFNQSSTLRETIRKYYSKEKQDS